MEQSLADLILRAHHHRRRRPRALEPRPEQLRGLLERAGFEFPNGPN